MAWRPRGPLGVWRALLWSLQGLRTALRREESLRLYTVLALVLIPLGIWLGQDGIERALLVGVVLLVLIAELFNTAIEVVFERYGDEPHPVTGAGKDIGSAAVFVTILLAISTWLLILYS
jgi:diacylglycerol kinase (ATP)